MVGAVIVLVGAILLIAALFTPWYVETFSGSGITLNENAYPGLPSSNGTIQYTCSGLPSGASCEPQTSYSNLNLNNTGTIAEAGYFLIIVGVVLGLIGAIIGFTSRNNSRRAGPAITLALVAMIVAIASVAMFAVALPSAIGQDTPGHSGTGPWSSFFGSTSASRFGIESGTLSWGPGIGWYLAIGAFVVLLVGMIILMLARKNPPEPTPTAVPAPASSTAPVSPPTP
jgi:hypothetical protein